MKTITFTANNTKPFSLWLKKFSPISSSLLLEVDEINSRFLAKVYNDERSLVKFSKITFDDAGFVLKPNKDGKRVKVGILNIPRLIKILDQFSAGEFAFTINYDEVIGETTELAGVTLLFKNKNLKVSDECTSLSIFKYISDEKFETAISSIDNVVGEFSMTQETIQKINSLGILDNGSTDNKLKFIIKDDKVFVSGKSFELEVTSNAVVTNDGTLTIFKEQFSNVDGENYNIKMGDDRLVFKSLDSETTTVLSMVEED